MISSPVADNPGGADAKVHFGDGNAAALLAGRVDELFSPDKHGWQQVKHNPSRTVYRGQIGDEEVFVKHFHSRSILRRLACRLGISDAKRELCFARYLNSCGVPAAPVLAATWRGAVQWVVTKAVRPAQSGDEWHVARLARGGEGREAIRQVARRLAEMVARMHAAGVIHRDLHAGNVQVRSGERRGELVLMDLHRVRRRRRLSRRAKAANLAQLCHDRAPFTTRSERLRFLRDYLRFSGAGGSLRGWDMMVSLFYQRYSRRHQAHRDRRILGDNRYFTRVRLPGGWRGHVVLACNRRMAGSIAAGQTFTAEDWLEALAQPGSLGSSREAAVVKESPSGKVVRRVLRVGDSDLDVYVKSPRRKRLIKVLGDYLRRGRAIRAFKLGHMLLSRHFATALPLAALQRRRGGALLESVLITEAVDAAAMKEFFSQALGPPGEDLSPAETKGRLLSAHRMLWRLGRMLRRLHRGRWAHRDLKEANVLAYLRGDGSGPQPVLIDLDGLSRLPVLTRRRMYQNLARLDVALRRIPAVTAACRLRVLLGYLAGPGSGHVNFKIPWRVVEQMSIRKMASQERYDLHATEAERQQ